MKTQNENTVGAVPSRPRAERTGTDRIFRAWTRVDFAVIGFIGVYLLVFALVRLAVSPAMELDEAEQFLAGRSLAWGYGGQPPLYSWIIYCVSRLIGLDLNLLVGVKYVLIFLLYASFFRVARRFHSSTRSFLVTASLLLFPTFSYEFNRDLSHTVLVTCVAAVTLLVFCRLYEHRRSRDFFLLGLCLVAGMLSKYNFTFFAGALVLATLTTGPGRNVMRDRRFVAMLLGAGAIIVLHVFLLNQRELSPLTHALDKSRSGDAGSVGVVGMLTTLGSAFTGLLVFLLLTLPFFWKGFVSLVTMKTVLPETDRMQQLSVMLRRGAVFGVLLPLLFIVIMQPGRFSARWLAPVLLLIPLALFSFQWTDFTKRRLPLFGAVCGTVAVGVLLIRVVTGFFPDLVGKVERLHISFAPLAERLTEALRDRGFPEIGQVTIVTAGSHVAANLLVRMPEARIINVEEIGRHPGSYGAPYAVVWDATRLGPEIPRGLTHVVSDARQVTLLEEPYSRGRGFPPYRLGLALASHQQ